MSKKGKHPSSPNKPKSAKPDVGVSVGRIPDRMIALMLAAFAFVLYANTLGHGYVLDDDLAISLNPNVQNGVSGIPDIFRQPYRENCYGGCLYRPLTLTTFAIEWALSPNNPFIGHFIHVLWYAATAALLFLVIRRLIPNGNLIFPILATAIFVVHPVHTEVVANLKSRDEILSMFFVLLSMHQFSLWFEKRNWVFIITSGLAFLCGLLSKEGAITMLLIFPLIGWAFFKKTWTNSIISSAWLLVPIVIFFLLRASAFSGLEDPAISMMDNPIVEAHGLERIGTSFTVLLKYFCLLVLPYPLISDYSYNVIPVHSVFSIESVSGILIYLSIAAYAIYSLIKRRMSGFFLVAFLISMAPYSQVFKVIGTLMGERLIYMPSLWFILGVISLIYERQFIKEDKSILSSWKQALRSHRYWVMALSAIALIYVVITINRNGNWSDNLTLFKADVAKAPNSVRLNDGYAEQLYKSVFNSTLDSMEIRERLKISEEHSHNSLSIKPGISAYNNLGNVYLAQKKYAEAVSYYEKALEIIPGYHISTHNITRTLMVWAREEGEKNNNPDRARELLLQALDYDNDNSDIWHLIGISYAVQRNYPDALVAFEKAYHLKPDDPEIKRDLAATYTNLGMTEKAKALEK